MSYKPNAGVLSLCENSLYLKILCISISLYICSISIIAVIQNFCWTSGRDAQDSQAFCILQQVAEKPCSYISCLNCFPKSLTFEVLSLKLSMPFSCLTGSQSLLAIYPNTHKIYYLEEHSVILWSYFLFHYWEKGWHKISPWGCLRERKQERRKSFLFKVFHPDKYLILGCPKTQFS